MHRKGDTLLFDPYEKIYAAGDKPTSAFLIVIGSVDIFTQTDLKVANLKSGEIFGEISLSLDSVRTVSAIAGSTGATLKMISKEVLDVIAKRQDLTSVMLEQAQRRLTSANKNLNTLAQELEHLSGETKEISRMSEISGSSFKNIRGRVNQVGAKLEQLSKLAPQPGPNEPVNSHELCVGNNLSTPSREDKSSEQASIFTDTKLAESEIDAIDQKKTLTTPKKDNILAKQILASASEEDQTIHDQMSVDEEAQYIWDMTTSSRSRYSRVGDEDRIKGVLIRAIKSSARIYIFGTSEANRLTGRLLDEDKEQDALYLHFPNEVPVQSLAERHDLLDICGIVDGRLYKMVAVMKSASLADGANTSSRSVYGGTLMELSYPKQLMNLQSEEKIKLEVPTDKIQIAAHLKQGTQVLAKGAVTSISIDSLTIDFEQLSHDTPTLKQKTIRVDLLAGVVNFGVDLNIMTTQSKQAQKSVTIEAKVASLDEKTLASFARVNRHVERIKFKLEQEKVLP